MNSNAGLLVHIRLMSRSRITNFLFFLVYAENVCFHIERTRFYFVTFNFWGNAI